MREEGNRALATKTDENGSALVRVLLLRVAGRRWGIVADEVSEILRAAWLRPLPGSPDIVEGVLDVRGEVIPVFDLARPFEGQRSELSPAHHFVVVRGDRGPCILHVERVEDLVDLERERIEDPGAVPRAPSVSGWVRTGDDLLLITDSARFLSDLERDQLDRALQEAGR